MVFSADLWLNTRRYRTLCYTPHPVRKSRQAAKPFVAISTKCPETPEPHFARLPLSGMSHRSDIYYTRGPYSVNPGTGRDTLSTRCLLLIQTYPDPTVASASLAAPL